MEYEHFQSWMMAYCQMECFILLGSLSYERCWIFLKIYCADWNSYFSCKWISSEHILNFSESSNKRSGEKKSVRNYLTYLTDFLFEISMVYIFALCWLDHSYIAFWNYLFKTRIKRLAFHNGSGTQYFKDYWRLSIFSHNFADCGPYIVRSWVKYSLDNSP